MDGGLLRRSAVEPVPRRHRDAVPQRRHRRVRPRRVLPERGGAALADGGVPAQVGARRRLRAAGLHRNLRRRAVPQHARVPVLGLDRAALRGGGHGRLLVNPLRYCPDRSVTRAEMAVLLLRAEHGSAYVPPACTGVFADVPCPATPAFPYSDWIEQLLTEGVTAGCAPPSPPVRQAQLLPGRVHAARADGHVPRPDLRADRGLGGPGQARRREGKPPNSAGIDRPGPLTYSYPPSEEGSVQARPGAGHLESPQY